MPPERPTAGSWQWGGNFSYGSVSSKKKNPLFFILMFETVGIFSDSYFLQEHSLIHLWPLWPVCELQWESLSNGCGGMPLEQNLVSASTWPMQGKKYSLLSSFVVLLSFSGVTMVVMFINTIITIIIMIVILMIRQQHVIIFQPLQRRQDWSTRRLLLQSRCQIFVLKTLFCLQNPCLDICIIFP